MATTVIGEPDITEFYTTQGTVPALKTLESGGRVTAQVLINGYGKLRPGFVRQRLQRLIAEGFAGFQCVGDALLCFLLAAERDERFAFEVEYVLFTDHLRRSQRSSREDIRELAADVRVILRSVSAAQHHVDRQLC